MSFDGLLLIDKREGSTSADVVREVKRRLRCKTGHLGTLDPFASGVLPLCLGEGTKIAQFLNAADKQYVGCIALGIATDTGDPTGSMTRTASVPDVSAAELMAVALRFCGERMQVPPMYSALKSQGQRLYDLARRGIVVERSPRPIRIEDLTLTPASADALEFSVTCSKGTYVRVLAEEIAAALGSVGHLKSLRRVRFGGFDIDHAIRVEQVQPPALAIIGLRAALGDVPEITLDAVTARRARQGYGPLLPSLPCDRTATMAKLVDPDGHLAAVIVRHDGEVWQFARTFSAVAPAIAALGARG